MLPVIEPLYARVLGSAWQNVPRTLRDMHDVRTVAEASGVALVERGGGLVARLAAAVLRLPEAGDDIPLRVRFTSQERDERWDRFFAQRRLSSTQSIPPRARSGDGLLQERMGPAALTFRLVYRDNGLRLLPDAWSIFGIPLPLRHFPVREACEHVDEAGRFAFDVEVAHVWIGLIVRYRGWLARTS